MAPHDPEVRRLRARTAALSRHHPGHPEVAADERRSLKARRAEQYVRRLVEESPTLTAAERIRLAGLLTSDGDDHVDQGGAR